MNDPKRQILILGGAKCVWSDIESLGDAIPSDVAAVNDIGAHWPGPLVFWASLHPRKLPPWEKQRRNNNYPNGYIRYGNKHGLPLCDKVIADWGGSSGLFAVKVALELGYEDIILAGIPMQAEAGHFFNKAEWAECTRYRAAWIKRQKWLSQFVSSCSGWTRDLLGAPECLNPKERA
jgi:hypothetical protein